MTEKLDTIVKETGDNPNIAVIWLHGLGADGNDFVPLVDAMKLPPSPAIRFIFPHAPIRPITINGGMEMRGWYDITDMSLDRRQDADGVRQSAALVSDLIEQQIRDGIDAGHIFLAGFSQGGAVALYTGLTTDHPLAGIIALSTYVPIADEIELRQKPDIFYAHGEHDPVIPMQMARQSHEWLLAHDIVPAWHTWPMQHQVVMEEIDEIRKWLMSRISDMESADVRVS